MKSIFAALAVILSTGIALSQDFYNGDFFSDSATANTIGGTRAFDEVQVMQPYISLIWANMFQYGENLSGINRYEYQFRTGMGFQNAGTLVASGIVTDFARTETGRYVDTGVPEYQIALHVNLTLQPGMYFMSIAAVANSSANVAVVGTDGGDYGPDTDPNPVPMDQLLDGGHWDMFNSGTGGADPAPTDLSYGIRTSPVPEPSTLIALGIGSVAFARRRKKLRTFCSSSQ